MAREADHLRSRRACPELAEGTPTSTPSLQAWQGIFIDVFLSMPFLRRFAPLLQQLLQHANSFVHMLFLQ